MFSAASGRRELEEWTNEDFVDQVGGCCFVHCLFYHFLVGFDEAVEGDQRFELWSVVRTAEGTGGPTQGRCGPGGRLAAVQRSGVHSRLHLGHMSD